MKERPILFRTEMVQAILQGRKTQTRREVKQKIEQNAYSSVPSSFGILDPNGNWMLNKKEEILTLADICPYGKIGDVLWVREKHRKVINCITEDESWSYYADMPENFRNKYPHKWNPSLHMPKEACRLKLRITNIKVERLQSISDSDAKAEGVNDTIQVDEFVKLKGLNWIIPRPFGMHQFSFLSLWCKIYGNDSWIDNPWVWVIEFEKIENKTLPKYTIFSGNPCEM